MQSPRQVRRTRGDLPFVTRLRATLYRDKLYISPAARWMASGGPIGCLARQATRADAVADLAIDDESDPREIVATMVVGSAERLHEPLCSWGEALGYGRAWISHYVVDLERPAATSTYGTRCGICRTDWVDGTPNFWDFVTSLGHFPSFCWICGGLMAQWVPWDVAAGAPKRPEEHAGRPAARTRGAQERRRQREPNSAQAPESSQDL